MTPDMDTTERDLPGDPRQVTEAVREAAEIWGATWDLDHQTGSSARGRLTLPVRAGLRHGSLTGPVTVEGTGADTARLTFHQESSEFHLWTPAVVVLLISVVGAILISIWPIFPELLPIAPLGAILALSGWLLVVTRLKHQGTAEFLELVTELLADDQGPAGNEVPPPGVVPTV